MNHFKALSKSSSFVEMESKAARIQQWIRDLRLPSLRSWSNIDLSSLSSEDHLEDSELSDKRYEDNVMPWNTNHDSAKKWKSSQNLSLFTHKEFPHEWYQSHSSKEEKWNDSTSEESIPPSLTPSTQSLHEIYHLHHYFRRTMKIKESQSNSPRHRKRLSASDPDFQFYKINNYQQDISWTPQNTYDTENLNTVQGRSNKIAIFHRTDSSMKIHCQEKYPNLKHKNLLRSRQFPIIRPDVTEMLQNSARRGLPYPPQSEKDDSLFAPHFGTQMNSQRTKPYLSQKSTDRRYDSLITYDMYRCTHNSVEDSHNIAKYQYLHRRVPQFSKIPAEDVYFHKTIRTSTLKYIKVIQRTRRTPTLTPQQKKSHRQFYFENSQIIENKQTWEI